MSTITNIVTVVSCLLIIGVFVYFIIQARKLITCYKLIGESLHTDNILESLKDSKLSDLCQKYEENMTIETANGKRSNTPSSEIFSELNICSKHSLNMKMLSTASSTLVGLGILGTFLGLTIGVESFDSSNVEHIQSSIQTLLAGMGTAFYTSLIGMSSSLIFIAYDKRWRNRLSKDLFEMTESLDNQYYIDDISLMKLNQQESLNSMFESLKSIMEEQTQSILKDFKQHLTYTDGDGHEVEVSNAVREILSENEEQSKALKSFSTDLAIELNNGFDEVLSRQMQQKLLPLMESVDATTKSVVEHIDKMSANVASPATDMIANVVDTLKSSMSEILDEFKHSLSSSATNELETLAKSLGNATVAMGNFPNDMKRISDTLQVTIEEVKVAITEISNTSANSSSAAMKQMQEQITFATTSISNAIAEVKDVMTNITQSSAQSSQDVVNKLSAAADQMGTFLNSTIAKISESVTGSMKNITEDVSNKQTDLLALQEDTTQKTEKLLSSFNESLDKLEKMNEYVKGTMSMFQQAQGQITGSTAHLQAISGDMKVATEVFHKSQQEYNDKLSQLQKNTEDSINAVSELLKDSGQMSSDYVEKFETIKQGLASIFQQLQTGLTEYSRTVQATTQKYLDQYSASLTQTTDALASTINQQNEVVEMLNETLSKK